MCPCVKIQILQLFVIIRPLNKVNIYVCALKIHVTLSTVIMFSLYKIQNRAVYYSCARTSEKIYRYTVEFQIIE